MSKENTDDSAGRKSNHESVKQWKWLEAYGCDKFPDGLNNQQGDYKLMYRKAFSETTFQTESKNYWLSNTRIPRPCLWFTGTLTTYGYRKLYVVRIWAGITQLFFYLFTLFRFRPDSNEGRINKFNSLIVSTEIVRAHRCVVVLRWTRYGSVGRKRNSFIEQSVDRLTASTCQV